MILVDTSVWIDHLRRDNSALSDLLNEERVLLHPFVLGELACGNLRKRDLILAYLAALPTVPIAAHSDVLRLLSDRVLWGKGIGWIDSHLLASALLSDCKVWTLDRSLNRAAAELGVKRAV